MHGKLRSEVGVSCLIQCLSRSILRMSRHMLRTNVAGASQLYREGNSLFDIVLYDVEV